MTDRNKLCPRANIWYAANNKVLICVTSWEVSTWGLRLSHRLTNIYAVLLLKVGVCRMCRTWWTPTWTTNWSWTSSSPTASRWIRSIRPLTLWKMGQGTSWYTCSSWLLIFNFLTNLSNNTQLKHVGIKHKSTNRFLTQWWEHSVVVSLSTQQWFVVHLCKNTRVAF